MQAAGLSPHEVSCHLKATCTQLFEFVLFNSNIDGNGNNP